MAFLAFLNMLFLKAVGFFLSVVLMWAAPSASATTIEPKDAQNLRLQFGVVADVHMETFEYFRFDGFAKTLKDMGKTRQDALVLVGDNTMNGQPTEYIMLYGLLSRYNCAKNTLVAMGNHDLNMGAYDTPDAIARHSFFYQSYTGLANDRPYCSREINGYTFVILGDEDPHEDCTATISQAQLDWLAGTLAAAPAGKPVFIFLHQMLGHTFGGWGEVGEQSEAIRAIVERYPNVFMFNGHAHTPQKVKQIDGVTYVNLPTLLSGGENGVGFQVEAYADRVLLRARNYIAGEWLEEYEVILDV